MVESKPSPLIYVVATVLIAVLVGAVNIPAHAMIADPNIGTPNELRHTPDPTPAQFDQQMRGPKVTPSADIPEQKHSISEPELPQGPDSGAVEAALGGREQAEAKHKEQGTQHRSSTMLGLALTAAILGALCAAGMLVVKYGPKPPDNLENTG